MGKEKLVNKPVTSRLGKETSAGDAVCGSKMVVPAGREVGRAREGMSSWQLTWKARLVWKRGETAGS